MHLTGPLGVKSSYSGTPRIFEARRASLGPIGEASGRFFNANGLGYDCDWQS
jgi:hypothetical protein